MWTTGSRLNSSMADIMRSLSSCLDATRMWRNTERVNLEKKPSTRLSQEPCVGVKVNVKRPTGVTAEIAGEALARPDQDDLSAAARAFVEGVARPGAKPEQS